MHTVCAQNECLCLPTSILTSLFAPLMFARLFPSVNIVWPKKRSCFRRFNDDMGVAFCLLPVFFFFLAGFDYVSERCVLEWLLFWITEIDTNAPNV